MNGGYSRNLGVYVTGPFKGSQVREMLMPGAIMILWSDYPKLMLIPGVRMALDAQKKLEVANLRG